MDVFLEYLLDKKSTAADVLKKVGIVVAALVVMLIVINVFAMFGQFMLTYVPLAIAGVVYGAYILMRNFNTFLPTATWILILLKAVRCASA